MQRLWLTLVTLAGALGASPARAQEVGPPHFEVGGIVSGLVAFAFEDGPVVVGGAGPRVTVNVTRQVALDLSAEVIGPTESSGTTALTGVKYCYLQSYGGSRGVLASSS